MGSSKQDKFVASFENEILSGSYAIGDRLPAERELADTHGVSRPLVHGALLELASRGLLRIEARQGVFVADFRREGSVEMLLSLINYSGGELSPPIFDGLLEMRFLFETETARLAALRAKAEDLEDIRRVLAKEILFKYREPRDATDIDFEFHLAIALASGNAVYPLLINSLKRVYERILDRFYADAAVIPEIFRMHRALAARIAAKEEEASAQAMRDILGFGESRLREIIVKTGGLA
ncbi:MAG TPA: FCD domain-containing protein [Rectinemataceae bacterium]|nr:FCD domain-containing protein [Rectinemataceae bacterium]